MLGFGKQVFLALPNQRDCDTLLPRERCCSVQFIRWFGAGRGQRRDCLRLARNLEGFRGRGKALPIVKPPIGIASYGIAGLESRTIGSFLREFERTGVGHENLAEVSTAAVAEHLRRFFLELYVRNAETVFGVPFDQIPDDTSHANHNESTSVSVWTRGRHAGSSRRA